jgi:hypothetical protein
MLKVDPGPDRFKLGFKERALQSFDFLKNYGLKCTDVQVTYLHYEAPKVFVNVYHGRASYELHVEIGARDGSKMGTAYDLDAVLGWREAPEYQLLDSENAMFPAETAEAVRDAVPRMAALFHKYADPLLRADGEAFAGFLAYCAIGSARLTEHYQSGTTRWKADMAAKKGDWNEVVRLYESLGADLSRREAAQLAEARRRAGSA